MATTKKPLLRPRNVILGIIAIVAIAIGAYGYSLAEMGGYLPWQEDPTPVTNDITPFAGAGFENLPTTPPRREATSAATPATSPMASPEASPAALIGFAIAG